VSRGKDDILSAKEGLEAQGKEARDASRLLARLSSKAKDQALENIADRLKSEEEQVLAANEKDCRDGRRNGLSEASLDRLRLDPERLAGIARDVRRVAAMPDPVAESFDERVMSNGLRVGKRRVPLGVIGAIYESRPNVTIDIAALCLKAGNAVILRGGSEAFHSNSALSGLVRRAISEACLPEEAVQFVESTDRTLVGHMLAMKEYIDLVIPRGSAELVRRVASEAAMPAITGGIGVCHTYVDRSAGIDMAVEIVDNAKVSRPSVCNALDTVLVHAAVAPAFLPRLADRWAEAGVEMRCDRRALSILGRSNGRAAVPAGEDDWGQEFLSLVASVKVVDTMDEALAHIDTYGSGHTDAIVTEDYSAAGRFLDEVDSGVVMVNASTRFNDGAELGLGAEVAISTNKLHARGPMGLRELTSYKWTVLGAGQVRS
jgi:glutamate-5-semialdehyde dehydrogenase